MWNLHFIFVPFSHFLLQWLFKWKGSLVQHTDSSNWMLFRRRMFISRIEYGQAHMHRNLVPSQGFVFLSMHETRLTLVLVQRLQWRLKDFQLTTVRGLTLVLLCIFSGWLECHSKVEWGTQGAHWSVSLRRFLWWQKLATLCFPLSWNEAILSLRLRACSGSQQY